MKLGFVKPTFNNEKRVAVFPNQIKSVKDEAVIEYGFGEDLDISDEEYLENGATLASKEEIFDKCDAVFSLKVIGERDYNLIKENTLIIGWTHPGGSGVSFMEKQAYPKNLIIVDIANNDPQIFFNGSSAKIPWIGKNFNYKNALTAGYSSVYHALISHNIIIEDDFNIAVLGSGNVAQGSFNLLSKLGGNLRMFYRRNMNEFKQNIGKYDIVVNGIEIAKGDDPIISLEEQKALKKGCFIIDAAADAGYAVEGSKYTSIDKPVYKSDGKYYYVVNNSPSLFYKSISKVISEAFVEHVYSHSISEYLDLTKK